MPLLARTSTAKGISLSATANSTTLVPAGTNALSIIAHLNVEPPTVTNTNELLSLINNGPFLPGGLVGPAPPNVGLTPRSLAEFLSHFDLEDATGLSLLATEANNVSGGSFTDKNIVRALMKDETAQKHFTSFGPTSTLALPTPTFNATPGLNLLLLNPTIASVIMAERKRRTAASVARPAMRGSRGVFPFGVGPAPTIAVYTGGALLNPPVDHPIEMRGGGYDIAMRGGQMPLLGPYRPLTDSSFISTELEIALHKLRATLKAKGKELADDVKNNIDTLISDLKKAEKAVKDTRDKLSLANQAVASGAATPVGNSNRTDANGATVPDGVSSIQITTLADQYNDANTRRQKLENKLFRVIIALNGVQVHP
jgi:hypothetical protein